ncbi:Uncharacterized membrane protein YfhO [Ruminococcaceae bacterium YRB3002]|nr:Uncharacterized membrane protein YfhO [Ruminococcaceae bacterium YRB3002]
MNKKAKNLLNKGTPDVLPQYLLSFIFPFLTIVTAFAILGCYPFGNRTMLTVDLYHQYAPYLVTLRDKILSGDSILYSWCDGLGNEYYAAFANYSASPLNILCIFFDAKTMPVFIAFVTALRAGLASLAMSFFLKANDHGRIDNITVAFAICYSLCGWFVTDFWNIMWCDVLILLPVICLGLRKLFLDRSWWLYLVSLAVAIASNYFTGYFLCIFLVFFAPVYCLTLLRPTEDRNAPDRLCFKNLALSAVRFGTASLLAGVSTAFITLPTYLILQHCSATGNDFPTDYNLTGTLFDFMGRFMVAASPAIRDGMANVHCGLVVIILLPLFFLLPKASGIGLRHKFGFGIIILVLYLSFTNRTLNFIWHGMHFPNQIPYRQSFLMPFVLVLVGFLTIRRLRHLPKGALGASVAGAIIFLILYEKFGEGDEGYIQMGMTLLFLIVQGIALKVVSDRRRSMIFCETLLAATIMAETLAGSIVSIAIVAQNEGFVGYSFFGKNHGEIKTYVDSVEGTDGHKTFERSELFPNNICDIQSVYNVKGMSIFSSTTRESFVKYNRNFGFHNNNINGFRNSGITRLTASLYGVRNLVAIENTNTIPKVFDEEYKDDNITVYGNPDALALGYMVDPEVIDYEPAWEKPDVFKKTNDWLKSMGVTGDCYTYIDLIAEESEHMSTSEVVDSEILYTVVPGSDNPMFKVTVENATEGADLYVYVNANAGATATVSRGDKDEYSYELRSYQIISLGKFDGRPVTLTVKYSKNPGNSVKVFGAELTPDNFKNAIAQLADEEFNVTEYDTLSVKGNVTALNDGLLFMTIPYSEGWSVKVDGEKGEITPVGDSYVSIRLDKGYHEIELDYMPQGLTEGVIISAAAWTVMTAVIVISEVVRAKRMKKREEAVNEKPC